MNFRTVIFSSLFGFIACTDQESIDGHWHEVYNDEVKHCYKLTDSSFSINNLSLGYTQPFEIFDGKKTLYSMLTLEFSTEYTTKLNEIEFNDTITWRRVNNTYDIFLEDLSRDLHVKLVPPLLSNDEFELSYEQRSTTIFIGKNKSQETSFEIQLNDVLSIPSAIPDFLVGHGSNNGEAITINADRNTPDSLLLEVVQEILNSGYSKKNIFETAIKQSSKELGLIRFRRLDISHLENELFPPCP